MQYVGMFIILIFISGFYFRLDPRERLIRRIIKQSRYVCWLVEEVRVKERKVVIARGTLVQLIKKYRREYKHGDQ